VFVSAVRGDEMKDYTEEEWRRDPIQDTDHDQWRKIAPPEVKARWRRYRKAEEMLTEKYEKRFIPLGRCPETRDEEIGFCVNYLKLLAEGFFKLDLLTEREHSYAYVKVGLLDLNGELFDENEAIISVTTVYSTVHSLYPDLMKMLSENRGY
jgi:hypothetical protein